MVWSDGNTSFYGFASSRGGASSGNGGTIEISGVQNLDYQGTVELRAPNGTPGTLMLDPIDIRIGSPNFFRTLLWNQPSESFVHIESLNQALGEGNVIISTLCGEKGGNIIIDETVEVLSKCHHLVMRADKDIVIDKPFTFCDISGGVGVLHLTAGQDILVKKKTPFKVFNAKYFELRAARNLYLSKDSLETNCENHKVHSKQKLSTWNEIEKIVPLPRSKLYGRKNI